MNDVSKVYQTLSSYNIYKAREKVEKMSTDTELENNLEHESIDLELKDLNIHDILRANKSFMRVAATIFHYGNQSLSAAQIVNCVRSLELLPLR